MKSNDSGFTLVELMIVVVVVGILAGVALPTYTGYVQRGYRTDARNLLFAAAQRLEQNYTLAGRYDQTQDGTAIDTATLSTWGLNQSPSSGTARYTLSFGAGPTATSFQLTATPAGTQASDSCGALSLTERNLKSALGQNPNSTGVSRSTTTISCWGR